MKQKRVLIGFPPTYLENMDQAAYELGMTRSELVRRAVSHWSVCDLGEHAVRQQVANRALGEAAITEDE